MKQIYITDDCEYKALIEGSEANRNNAKTAYKTAVDANIRNFNLRVICGTEEYTTSDIGSIKITTDLFGTDTFTIGSFVSETLDITIFRYCDNVDTGSPIIPFISLRTEVEIQTDIGVETQEVWQEVCMGMFYVVADGVTDDGYNTTTIRASSIFSNPKFGDKVFESSTSSNLNRDLYNIIDHILDDVNHSVSPNIYLLNDDLPDVSISDESGNIIDRPYKEIIEYIARLYGGYAKTYYDKDTNKVYLKFFRLPIGEDTGYFYDKSNYMSFKRSKDFLNIQKISCTRGENDVIWVTQASTGTGETSSDGYRAIYIECADMTEELLRDMFDYYHGYTYHPITSKIFGSPVLEVGDRIRIRGRGSKAEGAEMPLHNITYNITGSGLTMDIKSVYKVNPVTAKKTVKSTLNDMNTRQDELQEELNNLKDRVDQIENNSGGSGCECDLTGIQDEINNLKNQVNDLANKGCECDLTSIQTAISSLASRITAIENQLKDSPGNVTGDVINTRTLNILNQNDNNTAGTLTSKSSGHLNIDARSDIDIEVGSSPYLSMGIDSYTCVTLKAKRFNATDKEILMGGEGSIHGNTLDCFEIKYAELHSCKLASNLNGNGYIVTGAKSVNYTSSQSDYTSSLIDSGSNEHMIYNNMSYYDGELRWCWKETVFTYPECDIDPETDEWIYTGRNICYIEIPIFMAENIQNDYHINVSKMSWGDYRIIEKNPYYFILESQEEDFAFTFEVVAKLNDNQTLNNNAIIANEGYEVLAEEYED